MSRGRHFTRADDNKNLAVSLTLLCCATAGVAVPRLQNYSPWLESSNVKLLLRRLRGHRPRVSNRGGASSHERIATKIRRPVQIHHIKTPPKRRAHRHLILASVPSIRWAGGKLEKSSEGGPKISSGPSAGAQIFDTIPQFVWNKEAPGNGVQWGSILVGMDA